MRVRGIWIPYDPLSNTVYKTLLVPMAVFVFSPISYPYGTWPHSCARSGQSYTSVSLLLNPPPLLRVTHTALHIPNRGNGKWMPFSCRCLDHFYHEPWLEKKNHQSFRDILTKYIICHFLLVKWTTIYGAQSFNLVIDSLRKIINVYDILPFYMNIGWFFTSVFLQRAAMFQ